MSALGSAAAGLLLLLVADAKYKPEDPIPPGATAKVLPVAGKASPVEAALKDLGAKVTQMEIRIELSADVLFDFDKADLRVEATPALEKVVTVLGAYPGAVATIEGHTDNKGDDRYNQELSERRRYEAGCSATAPTIR